MNHKKPRVSDEMKSNISFGIGIGVLFGVVIYLIMCGR